MGSPRREAGRRANESQRPVKLERRFYMGLREVTNAEFRQFRPEHRSDSSCSRLSTSIASPRERELAGRSRLLQLVECTGRPCGCIRDEGRPAGAGRADHQRLSVAHRG